MQGPELRGRFASRPPPRPGRRGGAERLLCRRLTPSPAFRPGFPRVQAPGTGRLRRGSNAQADTRRACARRGAPVSRAGFGEGEGAKPPAGARPPEERRPPACYFSRTWPADLGINSSGAPGGARREGGPARACPRPDAPPPASASSAPALCQAPRRALGGKDGTVAAPLRGERALSATLVRHSSPHLALNPAGSGQTVKGPLGTRKDEARAKAPPGEPGVLLRTPAFLLARQPFSPRRVFFCFLVSLFQYKSPPPTLFEY